MGTPLRDASWVRHAFMLPPQGKDTPQGGFPSERAYRPASSAVYKFTNTSLGGNFAINNPPQFTRFADIREPGRGRSDKKWFEGMGTYYSEAIDDPKQIIHMSFGVPRYNTMFNFFTSFYDSRTALLANTGRSSSAFYNLGLVGGYIVSLPLQPFILGATAISRVYNFMTRQTPSKWYHFKPTMHTYWTTVNTIANDLAINLGLIPRVMGNNNNDGALKEPGNDVTPELWEDIHRILPDIFRRDGGIDVMALANRSQRMANAASAAEEKIRDEVSTIAQLRGRLGSYVTLKREDPHPEADARKYFEDYVKAEGETDTGGVTDTFSEWSELEGVSNFLKANIRAGNQFASFRVNHRGSMSESFSNSTRESDMAQTLNTKVAQGRSMAFNVMGGNISKTIGEFVQGIQSTVAGALDSVKLGGLATLAGTAFLDMPKIWDGSTANLPRAEYTIPLPSPYGNDISRYINMYIPIAMLLAGSLPLSAGRASYTSPFICQIFHQGRVQCQLGMVDSITINRGTGNVGWNADNKMLGAEVTISVVDMSTILHMPIKGAFGGEAGGGSNLIGSSIQVAAALGGGAVAGDQGAAFGLALTSGAVWDEQSLFGDYMAVLGGLPVEDTYYARRRLNLNMTRSLRAFNSWRSPSNFFSWAGDDSVSRMVMQFSQTSERFAQ